jgi:hypothetical protein
MSALLAPLTYVLARAGALRPAYALAGGFILALMPGSWETAGLFLPDNQAAVFSTVTLAGALFGMNGRIWGWLLAGAALGLAFLSKPHLPVVLAPSLLVVVFFWIAGRNVSARTLAIALTGLTLPLIILAVIAAIGLGIPRSMFLSPPSQTSTTVSAYGDGLPPLSREQFGARSLTSYTNIVRAISPPAWIPEELGPRAISGAAAAFAIAALAAMLRPLSESRIERLARWVGVALFGGLVGTQLLGSASFDALAGGAFLAAVILMPGLMRLGVVDVPRSMNNVTGRCCVLLASLAFLCLATIGFFSLNHVGVTVTTRQFQFLMPAFAIVAAIGAVAVTRSVAILTARAPFGVVIALLVAAISLAVPGSVNRRIVLLACSPAVGLLSQLLMPRLERSKLPVLGLGIAILSVLLGTPALNTLARARDFLGFPDDAYFRQVSGGARVFTFNQAAPWLKANIDRDSVVLTSKPYQVTYYAGLGWDGFLRMRIWDETAAIRQGYLTDETLESSRFDWIVEYNQFAFQANSDEAARFASDYEWLASRPYLQTELEITDADGRLMLYALRRKS